MRYEKGEGGEAEYGRRCGNEHTDTQNTWKNQQPEAAALKSLYFRLQEIGKEDTFKIQASGLYQH